MGTAVSRHFLGLDLGQAQDYTALAGIETMETDADPLYGLRVLRRTALGTPYPAIVERVGELLSEGPYAAGGVVLAIDATGVGRPVVEMIQGRMKGRIKAGDLKLAPVLIHGGDQQSWEGWTWRVPKRDLLSRLVVLFQDQRLLIPAALPNKDALIDELLGIGRRISDAGRDTYGAWREGQHDDLVLALALACWAAEQFAPRGTQGPPRHAIRIGTAAQLAAMPPPRLTPREILEARRRPLQHRVDITHKH